MKSQPTKLRQDALLRQLRADIGCSRLYAPESVLRRCELAYGREIAPRTWWVWRRSVGAEADQGLGGMSEASYILLLTKAALLRGNDARKGGAFHRVPIERLAIAVRAIVSGDRPWDVGAVTDYDTLKRLIELRALRTYTDRYLRSQGLKRSQQLYSKSQAVQILNRFPDYSYVFNSEIPTRTLARKAA